MHKVYYLLLVLITALCLSASLAACGNAAEPKASAEAAPQGSSSVSLKDDDTMLSWPFSEEIDRTTGAGISAFTEEGAIRFTDSRGRVTFESGALEGGPVTNEEEALEIAEDYAQEYGCLEGSELLFGRADTFRGITVYTFLQGVEGIILDRGIFKVITKEDGTLVAIANSLLTDDEESLSEAVDAERISYDLENRFSGYEKETWTGELTGSMKQTVSVSVTVMKDPATGNQYLADPDRGILCTFLPADLQEQPETMDRFETVCLQTGENIESKLITYSYITRVYDYFAGKGWQGPDGRGTASQLIFDDSGESDGNASFNGYADGFMNFSFGVNDEASQNLQVIAHEFMHGVSNTNHIGPYENETGALDEAMSDNMGDAVESALLEVDNEENTWFEYMHEIHKNQRPLYVWDEYYLPPAGRFTSSNDLGGVHTNSAIISMLSLRLAEAGMTPSERFDFWMMFDLTLSPATGFQETAARLPFVAEAAGMPEYAPVLRQAAKQLNLVDLSLPEELPAHQCLLTLELPDTELVRDNPVALQYQREDAEYESSAFPIRDTSRITVVLREGSYMITLRIGADPELDGAEEEPVYYFWDGKEWIPGSEVEPESFDDSILSVNLVGGKKYDLGEVKF